MDGTMRATLDELERNEEPVTVVFGGDVPALNGTISAVYDGALELAGRPCTSDDRPRRYVVPFAAIVYVRRDGPNA